MHQVSRVVGELDGSAAGARNREELQLVSGEAAIDDGCSVRRPIEAAIRCPLIVEQPFAVRAIGALHPLPANRAVLRSASIRYSNANGMSLG